MLTAEVRYPDPMLPRWAETSLWPSIRGDFLLWYDHVQPTVPPREDDTQSDPRWVLFHDFMRQTGGDFHEWLAAQHDE